MIQDRADLGEPDWEDILAKARRGVEEHEAAVAEVEQRRRARRPAWLLPVLLLALTLVGAWNAWILTRPLVLPPADEQAYALRRSAAAVAQEVIDILETGARWPSAAEWADLLGEDMTLVRTEGGFVLTNTDGEFTVTYDGSVALNEWVARGGYLLNTGGAP